MTAQRRRARKGRYPLPGRELPPSADDRSLFLIEPRTSFRHSCGSGRVVSNIFPTPALHDKSLIFPRMSEAGPSVDPSSPPATDSSVPPTPKRLSSRHDQSPRPSDVRRTAISSSRDATMTMEFPPRSYTVPERSTARHDPQITPLLAAQPLSGNQVPTAPLLPQTMPENRTEGSPFQHRTTRGRLLAFFGFGTGPELRERKDLMSLIWNLGFNGLQVHPGYSCIENIADS